MKKISKAGADDYLRRIYAFLRERHIKLVLTRLKRRSGECGDDTIWIDFREDIVGTFIHECLRGLYPRLV